MQSVKNFMRAIGNPSPELGIVSVEQALDEMEYQYLSRGYKVQGSHYIGAIKDAQGSELGYRVLYVLVKDEEPVKASKNA